MLVYAHLVQSQSSHVLSGRRVPRNSHFPVCSPLLRLRRSLRECSPISKTTDHTILQLETPPSSGATHINSHVGRGALTCSLLAHMAQSGCQPQRSSGQQHVCAAQHSAAIGGLYSLHFAVKQYTTGPARPCSGALLCCCALSSSLKCCLHMHHVKNNSHVAELGRFPLQVSRFCGETT